MKNLAVVFFAVLLVGCSAFSPKTSSDYLAKSEMYYKTGNLKAAWKNAQKALDKDASAVSAYGIMGSILYENGDFDNSIKYFEALYQAGDKRSEVISALGAAYASKGEYEKALNYLEESLRLNPSNVAALASVGGIYYSLGDYQKALEIYTHALNVVPSAPLYQMRAATYEQLGNMEAALKDYKAAGIETEIVE
jgi:Tfp pilus assembly protein PilF